MVFILNKHAKATFKGGNIVSTDRVQFIIQELETETTYTYLDIEEAN